MIPLFAKVKVKSLSHVRLFVTPWTVAHEAPISIEFSRQEYWSELPFSSPGDLPDPGIEPGSSVLQADSLPLSHWGIPILLLYLQKIFLILPQIFYVQINSGKKTSNWLYTTILVLKWLFPQNMLHGIHIRILSFLLKILWQNRFSGGRCWDCN